MTAHQLYGRTFSGGLSGVANEPDFSSPFGFVTKNVIEGLSYVGASFVTVFLMAPLLHRNIDWVKILIGFQCVVVLSYGLEGRISDSCPREVPMIALKYRLQLVLAVCAGAYIIGLAIMDFYRSRDAQSLLLFLLVMGIFVFSAFLNWTANVRSLLPMLPAIAIIVVRQFERVHRDLRTLRLAAYPLALGALISMAVSWGDHVYANLGRDFVQRYARDPRFELEKTWFIGHWGFQYYMEREGARAMDWDFLFDIESDIEHPQVGDTIIWWRAAYKMLPKAYPVDHAEKIEMPSSSWIATMNHDARVGFYDSYTGPIPYYFGKTSPEEFWIIEVLE